MVNELACMLFGMSCAAVMQDCPGLRVIDPWVREAPPGAKVQAAYMTLANDSEREMILTGVAAPQFSNAEFHRMWFEGDRMRMEAQATIAIPAQGQLAFEPGGYHVMLFNPDERMRVGDTVHIRLQCGAGRNFIDAPVRKAGFIESEPTSGH
jgi:copper(I)-binding protein